MAQWLVHEFTFMGIQFQNWMAVALAIIVLGVLLQWLRSAYRNRN